MRQEEWRKNFLESRGATDFGMARELGWLRGRPMTFPVLLSGKGCGPYFSDPQGSIFFDGNGGMGVHILGHGRLRSEVSGPVLQTHALPTPTYFSLLQALVNLSEAKLGLNHGWLASSGANALETAVQLARAKNKRKYLLTFADAYFARGVVAKMQRLFPQASGIEVKTIVFPTRGDAGALAQFQADLLQLEAIKHDISALVLEPLLGEGGCYLPDTKSIRELVVTLRQAGGCIIADETHTFLRTTEAFACSTVGLSEFIDIAVVGKALQQSAVLFREGLICEGSEILSGTYAGATSAMCEALEVLQFMQAGAFGPQETNQKSEEMLTAGLQDLRQRYPNKIDAIHACGLMAAFTFALGASGALALVAKLFKLGVVASVCGYSPQRVRFLLPVHCEAADLQVLFSRLDSALSQENL